MIRTAGLAFEYDDGRVLRDVSLTVRDGETMALMGANGTGKTTLLKLLAGLREPDAGTIECDGTIGFAPEDPTAGLFAETVADEVAFFPRNRGLDARARAESAMREMNVYAFRDRDPYTLSVGEQRRVSIASILAGDPDVVALDEPTLGLDRGGERDLGDRLGRVDATVVFSTHAADFAYAVADRAAVLVDGTIRRTGPVRSILEDEDLLGEAGIRIPGMVTWARTAGVERPPANVDEAVELRRRRQ